MKLLAKAKLLSWTAQHIHTPIKYLAVSIFKDVLSFARRNSKGAEQKEAEEGGLRHLGRATQLRLLSQICKHQCGRFLQFQRTT